VAIDQNAPIEGGHVHVGPEGSQVDTEVLRRIEKSEATNQAEPTLSKPSARVRWFSA
jgi:hypothetical protein